MWIRAVWLEGEVEEEGVLPEAWVDRKKNKVYWPLGPNALKLMKDHAVPSQNWFEFQLVKCKFSSESKKECEAYDLTTTAEVSDVDGDVDEERRKKKRKTFQDCVTGSGLDYRSGSDDNENTEKITQSSGACLPNPPDKPKSHNSRKRRHSSPSSSPPQTSRKRSPTKHSSQSTSPPPTPKSTKSNRQSSPLKSPHPARKSPSRSRSPPPTPKSTKSKGKRSPLKSPHPARRSPSRSRSPPPTPKSTKSKGKRSPLKSPHPARRSPSRSRSPPPTPKSTKSKGKRSPLKSPHPARRSPSRSRSPPPTPKSTKSKGKRSPLKSPHPARRRSPPTRHRSPSSSPEKKSAADIFPVSEARFQKRVLYLLADMRASIKELGKKYEPKTSPLHIEQLTSGEEFEELEESLQDKARKKQLIAQLGRIGGLSIRDNTRKVMNRMLSNDLMSTFNMNGNGGKAAFKRTILYDVVKASVLQQQSGTETEIDAAVTACLKYAPDRAGGSGRKQKK